MLRKPSIQTLALILFLFSFSCPAFPQGFLMNTDRPSRGSIRTTPFRGQVILKDHKVHARIVEAGVTVEVTETFHNRSKTILEGTYLFPLPRGAAATGLSLYIDGMEVKGEILSSDRARRVYTDIVRRARDPALLEYVDKDLLRASVYPINPEGDVSVKVRYITSVERSGSYYRLSLPSRAGAEGAVNTLVSIDIRSKLPVRNIYSPSHEIDILRANDFEARVTHEGRGKEGKKFSLYYALSEGEFGFSLLTHRDARGENYFLLMLSPKLEVDDDRIMPKDVVFVLDKSGSMEGEKWSQACDALKYCIKKLNPEDRFGLIAFSTEALNFQPQLVPASGEERKHAERFLGSLEAKGGTNIDEALKVSLAMLDDTERLGMVAFLTDGLPTVGVTKPEQIIKDVKEANIRRVRIFNFGVGYDVNTFLLDSLANLTRGTTEYIEPGENIEVKVSDFYSKINDPVLTDVELAIEGVNPSHVYPKNLEDIFAGSALFVVGKSTCEEGGRGMITLTGKVNGGEHRYTFKGDFTPESENNDFLPSYWAMRKVGYLLDEIRLKGTNDELIGEVTALGRKYGLVTPYTSALVVEEGERLAQAAGIQSRRETGHLSGSSGFLTGRGLPPGAGIGHRGATTGGMVRKRGSPGPGDTVPPQMSRGGDTNPPSKGGAAGPSSPRPPGPRSAGCSVRTAKKIKRLSRRGRISGKDGRDESLTIVAAGITFHHVGDYYIDSRFDKEMKKDLIEIEAFSDAYFELLDSHPDLKDVFALGERVLFVLDGKAYRIKPAEEKEDKKG